MSKQAIIENGKVVNIIEISGNTAVGIRLPEGQFSYDCGQYPVAIGDDFADGVFSRDGAALTVVPTPEQQIFALEQQLTQTELAIAELAGIVTGGV